MIYYYKNKGKKKRKLSYREMMAKRVAATKYRATRLGVPFDITVDDLYLNETCPILEIPLLFGGHRNNTPSLDRIDPALGYTKGNVRIISLKANRWKNDMSLADAKKLVKNWYRKV